MILGLTKQRIQKFLSYYRPYKKIFAMDMFFAALSAGCILLFPLVSGYITNEVLTEWKEEKLVTLVGAGILLLLLAIINVVSNIVYGYFGHAMGAKMEETMRQELLTHYQQLSFSFHSKNSVGKLMTIISNDLTGMTELFHHAPEDILMMVIKFIGAFVIMLNIHLPLTIIVFSVLPLFCFASLKADKAMEKSLLKNRRDLADMNENLEDILSGIRTVKAFGNEDLQAEHFLKKNQTYTKSKCTFYRIEALFYETMGAYPQLLTMLIVFFGALFVGKGELNLAVLVTFLLYAGSLAEPVGRIMNFMRLYEEGKAGFIRFMDMMETKPAIKERENAISIENPNGNIVFEHVSFQYEGTKEDILKDISIQIQSGEKVAFAGSSGIGKTTISSLMARFYDVTEGRILIDGLDIRDISFSSLRSMIGIVQQEVTIFNGTIGENICYGMPQASKEDMIKAAKLANIHEFIVSLENGYDSIVGTKGILLSGGQRQRISIARLFLKNPKILILDEATSALDYENEEIVQASMEVLMKDRTSIVIAHRLSTIKDADKIFVLGDKGIKEWGKHEELTRRGGEYAKLCALSRV